MSESFENGMLQMAVALCISMELTFWAIIHAACLSGVLSCEKRKWTIEIEECHSRPAIFIVERVHFRMQLQANHTQNYIQTVDNWMKMLEWLKRKFACHWNLMIRLFKWFCVDVGKKRHYLLHYPSVVCCFVFILPLQFNNKW